MTEKKATTKILSSPAKRGTALKQGAKKTSAKLPPMPKGDRVVAMIHFNTPEITEAAVQSIRKHGGERYEIVIFDNSADSTTTLGTNKARPFTAKLPGVTVIDNTKGQVIDFDKFLAEYPDREPYWAMLSNFGSAKHIRTVQELWKLIPQGFVLLEGDAILTKPIDWMWREEFAVVAKVAWKNGNKISIARYMPYLMYMNVPKLVAKGVSFFDPKRCWALQKGEMTRGNWYDTGASLLEDVINGKPELVGWNVKELTEYYAHYDGGSWKKCDTGNQVMFLKRNARHWEPEQHPKDKTLTKVAVCAIGRMENRYAKEFVEHYKRLGVSKLFIYDNWMTGDKEKLKDVLKGYGDLVEVIDYHDREYAQQDAYNDCYRLHGHEYGWIGFVDFDELLEFADPTMDVEQYFSQFNDKDCVLLNWRVMTDNGQTQYEPKPMAERFTEPMEADRRVKYTRPENDHVKAFVRGGLQNVAFAIPHFPEVPTLRCVNDKGDAVAQMSMIPYDHSAAWLNHYHTKTAEEFVEKMRRGFPNSERYNEVYRQRAVECFFKINERTAEREEILAAVAQQQTQR